MSGYFRALRRFLGLAPKDEDNESETTALKRSMPEESSTTEGVTPTKRLKLEGKGSFTEFLHSPPRKTSESKPSASKSSKKSGSVSPSRRKSGGSIKSPRKSNGSASSMKSPRKSTGSTSSQKSAKKSSGSTGSLKSPRKSASKSPSRRKSNGSASLKSIGSTASRKSGGSKVSKRETSAKKKPNGRASATLSLKKSSLKLKSEHSMPAGSSSSPALETRSTMPLWSEQIADEEGDWEDGEESGNGEEESGKEESGQKLSSDGSLQYDPDSDEDNDE